MNHFTLINGVQIPQIAFGPGSFVGWDAYHRFDGWPMNERLNAWGQKIRTRIRQRRGLNLMIEAFRAGVRLVDYSHTYKDEWILSRAMEEAGVSLDSVFLTNRASNRDLYNDDVYESCKRSLKAMGIQQFDLYMFHWPVPGHFIRAYQDMERLYREGLIRAIGVCNCHQHHLQEIMDACEIAPMVNQFEVHPLFTQEPLVRFCQEHHIQVEAYTALARNDDRLRNEKILKLLASKYHKSNGQIILKWHIQRGIIPVFRSSSPARIMCNLDVNDFELTEEEVQAISALNLDSRLRYDPDRSDLTRL